METIGYLIFGAACIFMLVAALAPIWKDLDQ